MRIPELLASCDVAFQCLTDNPLFAMTIPAKLQSYMACGIPVIASSNGETNRILQESQAGLSSPAGDEQKLANIIIEIFNKTPEELQMMGLNAREYYIKNFNKQDLLSEMDNYFDYKSLMGEIKYV
jgi:glycosyltransferase involved in cell wall biosynthesis